MADRAHPVATGRIVICSWCHAVKQPGGTWTRELVLQRGAMIVHGICEPCYASAASAIEVRDEPV